MSGYPTSQTPEPCGPLQRCRQLRSDIGKKAEFWKHPGRQQSKGTHSKLYCLCGNFQFWQSGKCWWGTFSSDFSDHLHYSTCDRFRLQPLQILCQAACFSWASSSTEEQVSRTSDHQKGYPSSRRLGIVERTKALIPILTKLWTFIFWRVNDVDIF